MELGDITSSQARSRNAGCFKMRDQRILLIFCMLCGADMSTAPHGPFFRGGGYSFPCPLHREIGAGKDPIQGYSFPLLRHQSLAETPVTNKQKLFKY